MAGATGIEPVSTVLETDVLPLDQAPKLNCLFILPYQFLKSNSKIHKKMILLYEWGESMFFKRKEAVKTIEFNHAYEEFQNNMNIIPDCWQTKC